MAQVAVVGFGGSRFVVVCCCQCAVEFGLPEGLHDGRREDQGMFYCPNGHSQYFPRGGGKDGRIKRLEKELETRNRELNFQRNMRRATENSNRGLRGVATRKKRELSRVSKGVCPKCNRSFQNLRRHMECKHGG